MIIRKYKIIVELSISELEYEVSKSIDEGWRPQGGIFFDQKKYYQAMIRI